MAARAFVGSVRFNVDAADLNQFHILASVEYFDDASAASSASINETVSFSTDAAAIVAALVAAAVAQAPAGFTVAAADVITPQLAAGF